MSIMDPASEIRTGAMVAARFCVEERVSAGGASVVYRARDLAPEGSGDQAGDHLVALKVGDPSSELGKVERFIREAEILSRLDHPGIIRCVAHGTLDDGAPFLVTEWLAGCDLQSYLRQTPLDEPQAMAVAVQLCEILSATHRLGIIHRDIKPGNIYLIDGAIEQLRLIDFGLAFRTMDDEHQLRSDIIVGTPSYIPPEQARSPTEVDARSDLYALGAVLYACLVGKAPFRGHHPMAVLTKVLLKPPTDIRELCPDLSPSFGALIGQLLAKNPDDRPDSADEIARLLTETEQRHIRSRTSDDHSRRAGTLSHIERHFFSVLVIGSDESAPTDDPADELPTRVIQADANVQHLADGTEVVVFSTDSSPIQMSTSAARAALTRHAQTPHVAMAIATGRGVLAGKAPIGEVIDRAVALLFPDPPGELQRDLEILEIDAPEIDLPGIQAPLATRDPSLAAELAAEMAAELDPSLDDDVTSPIVLPAEIHRALVLARHEDPPGSAARARGPSRVVIDDVTAGLIEKRFGLAPGPDGGYILLGETAQPRATHTLLGKPTPCLGRDRELARLVELFETCAQDSGARVALITAQAGMGKSRVAFELTNRLRARNRPPAIWTAYGDPMRMGSPFGMLSQLIRDAMSLIQIDSLAERRSRIRERVDELLDHDVSRVAAFLGELTGSPFPADTLMQLREARHDPHLMHDHIRRAWEDWLIAETHLRPVILVLDDLHWSDLPTVRFIDAALRNLRNQPIFCLAIANESVLQRFPDLWSEHEPERIELGPLPTGACEQIARQVLPGKTSNLLASRLARRSGGNPFYLEELLRTTTSDQVDTLPPTVLAMVANRLRTLHPDERRVLRVASVFGRRFWIAGVASLLDEDSRTIAEQIDQLHQHELVVPQPHSRFHHQDEYTFQQDLVREAAYAMLTPSDQGHAHRLAAQWLEASGERDPAVIAEHHWLGDSRPLALPWLHRAAQLAMEADHFEAVLEYVERALAVIARGQRARSSDASDEREGALRLLEAEAHNWRKEHDSARKASLLALERLRASTDTWTHAAHQLAWAAGATGDFDDVERAAVELIEHIPPEPSDMYLASMAISALPLTFGNRMARSRALQDTLEHHVQRRPPGPLLSATIARMKGILAGMNGKWDETADHMSNAVMLWHQMGSTRNACNDEANLGAALYELGQYDHSAAVLQVCLERARRTGLTHLHLTFEGVLAMALARSGDLDTARRVFDGLQSAESDPATEARNRVYRAQFDLLRGASDDARAEIDRAIGLIHPDSAPKLYAFALAVQASAQLDAGCTDEALETSRRGMALLDTLGELDEGDALLRLTHAEALRAAGRLSDARSAIDAAADQVQKRARRIDNPRGREMFLQQVAENQLTLELADEWAH